MSEIGQVRLDQLRYKAQQIIKTFMEVKKYKLGDCFIMAENGVVIKQSKETKGQRECVISL